MSVSNNPTFSIPNPQIGFGTELYASALFKGVSAFASESYSVLRKLGKLNTQNAQALSKLNSFAQLGSDWDSYGAAPISPKSIKKAAAFVKEIDARGLTADFVAPGPNEEVLVMLKQAEREAECLFYPDRTIIVTFQAQGAAEQYNLEDDSQLDLFLNQWISNDEQGR